MFIYYTKFIFGLLFLKKLLKKILASQIASASMRLTQN